MELDFSQLNNIAPSISSVDELKIDDGMEGRVNNNNRLEGHTEALELKDNQKPQIIYPKIEKERAVREEIYQTYRQQQEYIRKAGMLRADITKGVRAGQDHYTLLLKALECISVMTGDEAFLEQSKQDLEQRLTLTFTD